MERNMQYFRRWKNHKPRLSVFPMNITINIGKEVMVKNYEK